MLVRKVKNAHWGVFEGDGECEQEMCTYVCEF